MSQELQNINRQLEAIRRQLQWLMSAVAITANREGIIMTTMQEVQDKANATLATVTAETDVANAVLAVVNHQNADIATVKQQLADAIAAGNDPVALQKLADTIDAIQAADTSNAAKVAAAVTAGTPVATP